MREEKRPAANQINEKISLIKKGLHEAYLNFWNSEEYDQAVFESTESTIRYDEDLTYSVELSPNGSYKIDKSENFNSKIEPYQLLLDIPLYDVEYDLESSEDEDEDEVYNLSNWILDGVDLELKQQFESKLENLCNNLKKNKNLDSIYLAAMAK